MAEKKGLQALVKRPAPEAMWTHCVIHRESLATKELFPELREMMGTVIKTVNYIKTPSKCRLFAELFEEIGAQYQSFLPITIVERSKACTVFARSEPGS
jgi:hypothetical protein